MFYSSAQPLFCLVAMAMERTPTPSIERLSLRQRGFMWRPSMQLENRRAIIAGIVKWSSGFLFSNLTCPTAIIGAKRAAIVNELARAIDLNANDSGGLKTPKIIAEAQRMAREWMAKHQQ